MRSCCWRSPAPLARSQSDLQSVTEVDRALRLICPPSTTRVFPHKTARARAAKPLSPGRPSNTKNRSSMTCAQVSLAWCIRVRLGSWTFVFACVVNANTGVYLPDFRAWDWRSERRGGLPPSECHNMRILRGVMMWHSLTPLASEAISAVEGFVVGVVGILRRRNLRALGFGPQARERVVWRLSLSSPCFPTERPGTELR